MLLFRIALLSILVLLWASYIPMNSDADFGVSMFYYNFLHFLIFAVVFRAPVRNMAPYIAVKGFVKKDW